MIRVVIADDHRVVRVGLEQLLATFDDVELVGSADGGEAAVELATSGKPDVLLLDLSMPDLDGYEVLARLGGSTATRAIPVVVVTSQRLGAAERDRLRAARDVVYKEDISADRMRSVVEEATLAS